MKKYLWLVILLISFLCEGQPPPTIKLFTDFPNTTTPVSSDFLLFQRNNNFVNAAQSQYLPVWFASPTFTGNATVNGNFVASGIYYGSGLGLTNINATGTNASFTYITNNTLYSTNILVQNITNNTFITTNVTVEFPGGLTNLNLTPNSVMYSDNNDAEASIPNAVGVLTNNGVGGIGFNNKLSLTEIDALNFYPTNLFTGLTNFNLLGTDGNGLLTLGSGAITNITITNAYIQNLTNNTFINTNVVIVTSNSYFYNSTITNANITNLFFLSGKGNTLTITNVFIGAPGALVNSNTANNSAVITDSAHAYTNAVNAHGVFTNSATGPPSFGLLQNTELVNSSITIQGSAVALGGSTLAAGSAPFFDLSSSTNLIYRYTTNAVTTIVLTFGKAFTTNVSSADITFTAINAQDVAALETCCLFATNSSGSDHKITLPNGIGSPGLGLPPVITVTNKQSCWIYIQHYGNQATNCWFIPTY